MTDKTTFQYVLTKCSTWTSPDGKKYVQGVPFTPASQEEADYVQLTKHFEPVKPAKSAK